MKKGILIGSIGLLVLLVGIISYVILSKPSIALVGDKVIKTELKHEYEDKGISLKVNGKEINKDSYKVEIDSNINTEVLGTYKETYNITYKHKVYKIDRTVRVVDEEGPVITTNFEKIETEFCTGKEKDKLTFTAIDNGDGDVTEQVTIEKQEDSYLLSVSDSKGNKTIKQIPIVKEEEPTPSIKMNGTPTVYVAVNSNYADQGAYVADVCGNKKELEVKTDSTVNASKIGEYKVEYSATYSDQELKATRIVKVVKKSDVPSNKITSNKIVYLTFDDGPGAHTERLLNLLDKYNVKATFFVVNNSKYNYLIGEEARRGHAVGVHSYTHNYKTIYTSVDAYKDDFNKMNNIIEQQTGSRAKIFRFPGGASNTVSKKYKKGIMTELTKLMTSEGYYYFDWNVSSGDADGNPTKEKTVKNVINGMRTHSNAVILMHDIHKSTVDAMEEILKYGTENGFTFKVLDVDSPKVRHRVNN